MRESLLAFVLVACGANSLPAPDGGVDAAPPLGDGSANDVGAAQQDGGGSDAALAITYRCGNYGPQPSCAACEQLTGGTNTQPCVYCGDAGFVGICLKPGLSCVTARPSDLDWCHCGANDDPSPCPLATDVCVALSNQDAGSCDTCGGSETNGLACRGGGVCSAGACN